MTRKIASLFLILFLISPVMGITCPCCPAPASSSTMLAIGSEDCCCEFLEVSRDPLKTERIEKPLQIFERILTFSIAWVSGLSVALEFSSSSPTSSPPASETPLYLTHRVLRL